MKRAISDRQLTDVGRNWVVVANASKAIIFSRENRRDALTQSLILENTSSRKKVGELQADKGGRSFDSHGKGRHTIEQEKSGPKQQLASIFAQEIVDVVNRAAKLNRCTSFGVIAAPEFLGLLREAMSHGHSLMPTFEIDKNVVQCNAAEIGDLVERCV